MRFGLGLLVLLVLVAGCSKGSGRVMAPYNRTATVYGTVRDTAGTALAGVGIAMNWTTAFYETQTAGDGSYRVVMAWSAQQSGESVRVSMAFTKASFQPYYTDRFMNGGDYDLVDVALTPQ